MEALSLWESTTALKQMWKSKANRYCSVYNNLNVAEAVYSAV